MNRSSFEHKWTERSIGTGENNMTLTNYWWLLIWVFVGGLILSVYIPKYHEVVLGKMETRAE